MLHYLSHYLLRCFQRQHQRRSVTRAWVYRTQRQTRRMSEQAERASEWAIAHARPDRQTDAPSRGRYAHLRHPVLVLDLMSTSGATRLLKGHLEMPPRPRQGPGWWPNSQSSPQLFNDARRDPNALHWNILLQRKAETGLVAVSLRYLNTALAVCASAYWRENSEFCLPGLCSRLRPDVRDRQTDVGRASSPDAAGSRGGGITRNSAVGTAFEVLRCLLIPCFVHVSS